MFDELRAAVSAARAREQDPAALSAQEALELATLGSARALGLDAEVGSLLPGKRGDLAVVSLEGSPYLPWEDPAAGVVFGGSPERVLLTVVDGTERYRKGKTEWHELIAAATAVRRRLLSPTGAAARA
jgi:5-methylthioadenosine/S-adenosylhomocysteine deaminase